MRQVSSASQSLADIGAHWGINDLNMAFGRQWTLEQRSFELHGSTYT